jgi:hypothetical protein
LKCSCGKEANEKNSVRIEQNQIIFFCSPHCVWAYLERRFAEEGKVFAGKIEE